MEKLLLSFRVFVQYFVCSTATLMLLIKEIVSQNYLNIYSVYIYSQLLQIAKCFGIMLKSSIEHMYMHSFTHSFTPPLLGVTANIVTLTSELIKCVNLYKNLLELYASEMPKIT